MMPFMGLGAFFVLPLFVLLFFAVVGLFNWLWNITIPQVFNLRPITFWQAFRLILIAGMLFGGTNQLIK